MSIGNLKDGIKIVRRVRFSLDDLISKDLKLKIDFLKDHPDFKEGHEDIYQFTLDKLEKEYKERNKK